MKSISLKRNKFQSGGFNYKTTMFHDGNCGFDDNGYIRHCRIVKEIDDNTFEIAVMDSGFAEMGMLYNRVSGVASLIEGGSEIKNAKLLTYNDYHTAIVSSKEFSIRLKFLYNETKTGISCRYMPPLVGNEEWGYMNMSIDTPYFDNEKDAFLAMLLMLYRKYS